MVGKNDTWFAEGTWSARNDAVCATGSWVDLPSKTKGTGSHCWTWYKINNTYFSSFKPNEGGYGAYMPRLSQNAEARRCRVRQAKCHRAEGQVSTSHR